MVVKTSLLAYQSILESLGERQIIVLKALKEIEPANNRMIGEYLRKPINTIVPRIFELRAKRLVVQDYIGIDSITKRSTIFWKTKLL